MNRSSSPWYVRYAWILPPAVALLAALSVGYQGLHGQDAHDYLRLARAWSNWWIGGPRPVQAEHPHGYPFLGASIGQVLGGALPGMRALSFASLLITIAIAARMPRGTLERAVPWASLVLLAGSPFLLRHALTVMSDLPAIACCTGVWACLVLHGRGRGWRWLAGGVLLAGLAAWTRMATAPLLLGGIAAVVLYRARPWLHWTLLVMGVLGLLLLSVLAEERAWLFAHGDTPLAGWSPLNAFRTVLQGDDGVLRYTVPNGVYVLSVLVHPGFLSVGALLLPFVRRDDLRDPAQRLAAGMVLGYLLFIAGMPFQNDRVLLLAQPFVAVLFLPAFGRALQWSEGHVRNVGWVLMSVVLVQLVLFARAMRPFIAQERVEREWAAVVCASGARQVYTHGLGGAIGTWCPAVQVTELWYAPIGRFAPDALMLVRPHELQGQWAGLHPERNWRQARGQGLEVVKEDAAGWVLYRVTASP